MIIAMILSVLIPTLIYFLAPALVRYFSGDPKKYLPWLFVGMALYVISWWLPSPLIEGRDTNFSTHFVGGGLFTGFVWYYVKMSLKWKVSSWLYEAFSLFALVSALGVANELFEIVLYEFHAMKTIADTSWDLLANTLGALTFYCVYAITNNSKSKLFHRHDSRD